MTLIEIIRKKDAFNFRVKEVHGITKVKYNLKNKKNSGPEVALLNI